MRLPLVQGGGGRQGRYHHSRFRTIRNKSGALDLTHSAYQSPTGSVLTTDSSLKTVTRSVFEHRTDLQKFWIILRSPHIVKQRPNSHVEIHRYPTLHSYRTMHTGSARFPYEHTYDYLQLLPRKRSFMTTCRIAASHGAIPQGIGRHRIPTHSL